MTAPSSPEIRAHDMALALARDAYSRAADLAELVGIAVKRGRGRPGESPAYRCALVLAEVAYGVRSGTLSDASDVRLAREALAPFSDLLASIDHLVDARLALGRGAVTAAELAALAGVSVQYVRRLVAAGELGEAGEAGHGGSNGGGYGGAHRIPAREARRWLASRT